MTNQGAPEIYALHTVPNEGKKPWFGIYAVRADAEHDAKVMRDATGRDWSVVRLVVADTAATPTGPITRYEVVDCIDSKHVPAVIPNGAGPWVRYEDHVAALVDAQQPAPSAARPVTPYTCPKCHALWLHWPAEQTGFGRDTLNCRSADHCHYCEKVGVEQLQRLERVPAALTAPQPSPTPQAPFQQRVQPWLLECFGAEIAADRMERNHRFLEESLELVQSLGCTASEAHQLVDYVFGRPVGDPPQEVGGVMVTLAALCLASGLDMHDAGEVELVRISAPEVVAKIRAKQAAKPKHSPLLQSPTPQADSQPAHQWDTGYPPLPATYYLAGGAVRTWDEGQMRAYVDADRAARATADSTTSAVTAKSEPMPFEGGGSFEASTLRNFLAILHKDGGHYTATHGIIKSADDAEKRLYDLIGREVNATTRPSAMDDARRLLWSYRYYGSDPYSGYALVDVGTRSTVLQIGNQVLRDDMSNFVDELCNAHNVVVKNLLNVMSESEYAKVAKPDAGIPTSEVPVLDRARIREIFMAHGFTVKEGQTDLKQYVYDAADALLRAARAPADSVTAPAAGAVAGPDVKYALTHADTASNLLMRAHEQAPETWRGWYDDALVHIDIARKALAADPTLPAQAADSVLEDAARYCYLRDVPMAEWPDELVTAFRLQQNAIWDAAIDAARKQGGAT